MPRGNVIAQSKVLAEKSMSDMPETDKKEVKDDKAKEPAVPHGSLTEAKALYSKKDSDGKYQWVTEEPVDVVDAAENEETARYAFLVRKRKSYDSRKKYDIHSIIVQSPWLKKALGVVLADYPGITTNLDRLVFQAPFHPFVHRWTRLADLLEKNDFEDPAAREHLQLFRDILFEELRNAIAAKTDLVKNGVITFEYLWTIFEPQTLVYSVSDGKECLFKVDSSSTGTDQRSGLDFQQLNVWSVDWDGTKFGQNHTSLRNFEFTGTRSITTLPAYPLDFHIQKEELVQRLVLRGKLFESFAGYHYKAYRGPALGYGRCGMIKHRVESRVIIDCDAHNRFLPNNAVYFNAIPKPRKTSGVIEETIDEELSDDDASEVYDDDSDDYLATPSSENDASKPKHRPLTTEELLLAVPYVRGYAIKTKKWLWFYVDQIEEIKFAENAFASLVLPTEQKSLIRAFVESQVKYKDDFDDIIAGKGRGMIMLLAGPPGVGKTLTSESVAEDMRVPLYVRFPFPQETVLFMTEWFSSPLSAWGQANGYWQMMSAGDLGLDPSGIEESLNLVLDMVSKWNAVLLLDEADVFLEARSSHDLERNKMVSIFLRVLEYYEGVLFLTTNRIENIDEAFHSRIHVTVKYPNLSIESRRHIWQTFLGHDNPLGKKDLDRLAKVNLNGRQIKNILKTAQMLARSEGSQEKSTNKEAQRAKVGMRHLDTILAIERGTSWE